MPDAELARQKEANRVLRELYEEADRERRRADQALELAAQSQLERGIQLLDLGDATGLLHILAARETVPESSGAVSPIEHVVRVVRGAP